MKKKKSDNKKVKQQILFVGLFFLLGVLFAPHAYSQQGVAINTSGDTANSSAMLDISSASKGLLIPRVSLNSINDTTTIPGPATSLLVYNTNASMIGGSEGFWYYNGAIWVQAIGPQGPAGATGPAGPVGCATANTVIKSNGTTAICSQIFDDGANVGIGTQLPAQKLDVSGNLSFSGALMPASLPGNAGQVLKSAGSGLPPIWGGAITTTDIYSAESTSGITLSSSWQIVPGESITINNLAVGDRVIIQLSGNAYMQTVNYGTISVAPFVNGVMLDVGGFIRLSLDYDVAWINWQNFASVARYTVPSAGSYTFDVRAIQSGGGGTITVGGDYTQAAEGVMVIYVLKN